MRCLLVFLLAITFLTACPPGSDYDQLFNKCYQYYNTPMIFLAAEKTCEQQGGNLVEISNGFENTYVATLVSMNSSYSDYWIGATLLLGTSWMWTNNDNVTYSNWAPDQSESLNCSECVAVGKDNYLWTKQKCNSQKPFVCSFNPNGITTTVAPTEPAPFIPNCYLSGTLYQKSCPDGYSLSPANCRCYKLYPQFRNTFQANQGYCEAMNASLVKIDSADLNTFISKLVNNDEPWLGLSCWDNMITRCQWVDGSAVSGYYSNFASGEPKYASPIFMYYSEWTSDSNPNSDKPALCEKPSY